MKPHVLLLGVILALALADSVARAQAPPTDWVDPATGHRVIRLSGDGGGSSLYFHQNTYTPKGDKLVFDTRAGIAAVDLTKLGKGPVTAEVVVPGARAIATAWRTPDVYYRKSGALYATNLETKATRKVAATRGSVVNADETLVIGFEYDPDAAAKVKELGLPMLVTADLVAAGRAARPAQARRAVAGAGRHRRQDRRGQEGPLLDRVAQPPAGVAGRPAPPALLPRRGLAPGGPRLDDPHRRQGAEAHAQADHERTRSPGTSSSATTASGSGTTCRRRGRRSSGWRA